MANQGATGSNELIRYQVIADGTQDTARGFDQVTGALTKNAEAANQNVVSHRELGGAMENTLESSHRLGTAFRFMSSGLYALSPALGESAHAFHMAAGAGTALGEALGISASGALVAGGLVVALALYASHLKDAKKETEDLAKATKDLANDETTLAFALNKVNAERDAAIKAASDPNGLQAKINAQEILVSRLSKSGNTAEWSSQQSYLTNLRQQRGAYQYTEGGGRKDQLDEIARQEALATGFGMGPGSALSGAAKPRTSELGDMEMQLSAITAKRLDVEQKLSASLVSDKQKQITLIQDLDKSAYEHRKHLSDIESQDQTARTRMEAEQDKQIYQKKEQLVQKHAQSYHELGRAGFDAFQTIGSQGINALAALAKGQKVTAKALLSGIGDAMVASGERYMFEGLAMEFLPFGQGSGTALIGVGSAEVAAGIALGAATRGSAPVSGGSATSQLAQNYATGLPTSPYVGGQIVNLPSAGGTTVIYLPNVMTPADPYLGQQIARHLQEAKRQGVAA